jgi:hypothetical protein
MPVSGGGKLMLDLHGIATDPEFISPLNSIIDHTYIREMAWAKS